jgi:hypothetical protein
VRERLLDAVRHDAAQKGRIRRAVRAKGTMFAEKAQVNQLRTGSRSRVSEHVRNNINGSMSAANAGSIQKYIK